MVENSDVMIGIGGGDVARDELLEATEKGREVRFYNADMNHQVAREKASSKGVAAPIRFSGAATRRVKESLDFLVRVSEWLGRNMVAGNPVHGCSEIALTV
jgi:hypothetical protein